MQGSAAIAEGALFFIIQRFEDLTSKTFVSCSVGLSFSTVSLFLNLQCFLSDMVGWKRSL